MGSGRHACKLGLAVSEMIAVTGFDDIAGSDQSGEPLIEVGGTGAAAGAQFREWQWTPGISEHGGNAFIKRDGFW